MKTAGSLVVLCYHSMEDRAFNGSGDYIEVLVLKQPRPLHGRIGLAGPF